MTRFEAAYWEPGGGAVPDHDVTLEWVEQTFSITSKEIRLLVREGFVDLTSREGKDFFDPTTVRKIAFILALKRNMGVNMAGIEIILNLKSQLHWHITRFNRTGDHPDRYSSEGAVSIWEME
ncbi:MAG: chaperone modulator CbpM [Leptospirales bacterium]